MPMLSRNEWQEAAMSRDGYSPDRLLTGFAIATRIQACKEMPGDAGLRSGADRPTGTRSGLLFGRAKYPDRMIPSDRGLL